MCVGAFAYCIGMGGVFAEEKHLRLIMDCAQICQASADFMLRGSSFEDRVCGVCADVCESCADSCESFSSDAQMRLCAEACRECAAACREMSVAVLA
ncbi:MAG: four-helix bundle copper-binding protein [Blastocatellia bacterium]